MLYRIFINGTTKNCLPPEHVELIINLITEISHFFTLLNIFFKMEYVDGLMVFHDILFHFSSFIYI